MHLVAWLATAMLPLTGEVDPGQVGEYGAICPAATDDIQPTGVFFTRTPQTHYLVCFQGVEVSMVSRGDSTLRGHFPSDLASLEAGMSGECK